MTCSPNKETFIYNIISYAYTVVHLDKDLYAKKFTLCKLQMTCQMSCAHDWICCFCRLAVVINNETFENEKLWRSMQHLKTTMSWDNSRRQSHLPKPSYFEWVSAALVIPKLCISGLAFKNGCPLMFLNYAACCCFQTILYEESCLHRLPLSQTLRSVRSLLHSPHSLHMNYQNLHSLNHSHTMF